MLCTTPLASVSKYMTRISVEIRKRSGLSMPADNVLDKPPPQADLFHFLSGSRYVLLKLRDLLADVRIGNHRKCRLELC